MTSILGGAVILAILISSTKLVKWLLKKINPLIFEGKLYPKVKHSLPPGDLGWPLIGNMWTFLGAFKSSDPDSFMRTFVSRFGNTGIYKGFMFGKPCVFVTTPETCKRVLTDDDAFTTGWPKSTVELMGHKSFIGDMSYEEHKRLRRLTSAPINGYEALAGYVHYINDNVVSSLEQWSGQGTIEVLTHIRNLTFRIIMHIFLGSSTDPVMESLEKEYTALNLGIRALAINLPGFAFHKALKARKKLVAVLKSVVTERRSGKVDAKKKNMLYMLMEVEDDKGKKLSDEEIIDLLLMYLNAGHESSAHVTMWAVILLQQHPEFLRKAKEEAEEIVKKRPPSQSGVTLKEIREMKYLSQVIDETLRVVTFSSMVFREAKHDVELGGYTIPKGWRVIVWFRNVHFDPQVYSSPMDFNPDRWENFIAKAGSFLPFGAGSRLCPGNDLTKIEMAVFLHHFLLNYQMEKVNPKCELIYLPHKRPTDNCLATVKKLHL